MDGGKGTCHQARQPQLNPQDSDVGMRDPTPTSCTLTLTYQWKVCAHTQRQTDRNTHTHTHKRTFVENK